MRPLYSILVGVSLLLALEGITWAASEQAMKLRGKNALSEYSPPEAFLSGNLVADEVKPGYLSQGQRCDSRVTHSPGSHIKAEQERGPEFLPLANAPSALYPKGSEEKRLLDAMLLAVPR